MSETRPSRMAFYSLVISIVTLIVVGFLATYIIQVRNPMQDVLATTTAVSKQVIGLGRPVDNRLAAHFVDANNDLIADVPTDSTKQVNPDTLTFTYVPTDKPEVYQAVWKDFTDHLAKVTGKPVNYVLFKSTNDQLKAMRDGQLHVTGFNTGAVPAAVCLTGFVPLFSLGDLNDPNSGVTHTMQLITPANSPLRGINDIKGQMLTLVDPSSNTGFKAPIVLLATDFNMVPEKDYFFHLSYGHDNSIEGIAKHEYKIAAVASDLLQRNIAAGKITPQQYRVLYTSERFRSAGLGHVYNLHPELAAKVKEAFASFPWKGTSVEKHFIASKQNAFSPVHYQKDWALVRRIDNALGQQYMIR